MESSQINSQVLIKLLIKKPGIKDNNIQVQKLKLECLKTIFNNFSITRYSSKKFIFILLLLLD